jgi:hypothetical protein
MLRDNGGLGTDPSGDPTKAAQDSRTSALLAARNSIRNISSKQLIDKRFNKILFNMHGVPVQPNVTSQQQKKQLEKQQKKEKKEKKKKNRNVEEQHV